MLYFYSDGQLTLKLNDYSTAKVEFVDDLFKDEKVNDFDEETETLAMLRESDYYLYIANLGTYRELLSFVKLDLLSLTDNLFARSAINNLVIFNYCNIRKLHSIELKFKLLEYLKSRLSITNFSDLEVIRILKAFNRYNDYVFKIIKVEDIKEKK